MTSAKSHPEPQMAQRASLRRQLRDQRMALTAKQQTVAAQQLCAHVTPLLQGAKCIAAYLTNDGEISPHAIIQWAWQHQIQVVLPVLHPFVPWRKGALIFVEYTPETVLHPNRFGILEPRANISTLCPIHLIDHILVPLVGFDHLGNRIGMGGGYYDRTLAGIMQNQVGYLAHPVDRQPALLGLAHSLQQVANLPHASWDIPMSHIVTEQKCITIT